MTETKFWPEFLVRQKRIAVAVRAAAISTNANFLRIVDLIHSRRRYFRSLKSTVKCCLEALEDAGGAHASAYAHGYHAVAGVFSLEVADQGGG